MSIYPAGIVNAPDTLVSTYTFYAGVALAITPEACRAGRGLLEWSMRDLATRAGVSLGAVNRFESDAAAARRHTLESIEGAFVAEGVELVADSDRTGAVLVYARRCEPPTG